MQLNTLSMVHRFLEQSVKPGSFCIDATAGKGRDTALLCRLAGEMGRVLAFDIQQAAVDQTKALLAAEGLTAEVVLDSHAHMERYAEAGTADCVVFNFGRGTVAIALYYGGANGYTERDAVLAWLETLDDRRFSVLCCDWVNRRNDPPMPIFIWKER